MDAEPKILDDPVVLRLMDEATLKQIRSNPERTQARWVKDLRAHVVIRSRYAEDRLEEAVRRGVTQYIILGAGYDTFAYRQPEWAKALRIFEVDQSATQRAKQERLREAGIAIPDNLEFVPINFESTSLREGMNASGFDPQSPAFVACLGVLVYLTERAVMDVFRFAASLPPSSEMVFTFSVPESALAPEERKGRDALAAMAEASGEQWITHFDQDELLARLRGLGFSTVTVLTPEEMERRYLKGRADVLRATRRSIVASAVVG